MRGVHRAGRRPADAGVHHARPHVEGKKITTIEGLDGAGGKAVQKAWAELDVLQCGWCQSGQQMAAAALLTATPKPTGQQITDGMTGNICRCATYTRIHGAVARAAEIMG